jgi:hypothetical protein
VEKNIVLNRIISEVFVAPYICDVCEKSDITTMRQFYSKEKKRYIFIVFYLGIRTSDVYLFSFFAGLKRVNDLLN